MNKAIHINLFTLKYSCCFIHTDYSDIHTDNDDDAVICRHKTVY